MAANRAALEAISALAVRRRAGRGARWPPVERAAAASTVARPARSRHGGRARPALRPGPEDDPGDVDLYLALAKRTGGPVLELAAGSGRLAVPLAEAGHQSRPWTSTRPCSPAARAARQAAGVAARRRRSSRRTRRPAAARRRAATASRSSRSTRSCCWPAARPASARSGRSPRISRRAASRSSTCGSRTPTTSPASTAGSCSSGCGRTPTRARS